MQTSYHPFQSELWRGRTDAPTDLRWHQHIKGLNLNQKSLSATPGSICLLGFGSEEGVRRNQGRPGAAAGPTALRKALAGLPWARSPSLPLLDAGDLRPAGKDLETAQAKLAQEIQRLHYAQLRPLILGGGHETAWGSYWGLRQAVGPKTKLGIINLDAHFDLRQPAPTANSGTPFFQAAQWCQEQGGEFAYCCLGIQEMSNPASLFATAESLGVQWVSAAQIQQEPASTWEAKVDAFVASQDWIYLTLDLDAFAAPFAPGVSAPSVLGLDPRRMLNVLERIAASGKLALLDICELNPGLDQDQRTAKLGAALAWTVIRHWV